MHTLWKASVLLRLFIQIAMEDKDTNFLLVVQYIELLFQHHGKQQKRHDSFHLGKFCVSLSLFGFDYCIEKQFGGYDKGAEECV